MPSGPEPYRTALEGAIGVALEEDLGGGGPDADVTTVACVPEGLAGEAEVVAKGPGIVCGIDAVRIACERSGGGVEVEAFVDDGAQVSPGQRLATLRGRLRTILTAERTALNVLGHLSGIATLTRAHVERAPGVGVLDTRKTLPGLRVLQKHAVRCGGGVNHRMGLHDAVLVKDNHIVAAGGVGAAVRLAKEATGMPVQVECSSTDEVDAALDAGADAILLDNQSPAGAEELVRRIRGRAPDLPIESSGGMDLDTIAGHAAAGVDRISVGRLTHSAPALDVSLRLVRTWNEEG